MKPPRFLNDLYRDLRDRRLLPLVGVLLVAIPALPLLLGSRTGESSAPPAIDAALSEKEIPTMPAVLASDPGLRDYHERLEALRSKNPFAQQFSEPSAEAAQAAAVSEVQGLGGPGAASSVPSAATGGGGGFTSGPSTPTTTDTSTATTSETAASTSSTQSTSPADTGSGQGSSSGSGSQWFTYRIDVVTGPSGDTELRKNVKRMTALPSQSNPVALFMGASEGGKRATFLVSTDVVRTHGDGNCVPSPSDCQLLTLRPGEERKFEYAPHGEPDTYKIILKEIRMVPIDEPGKSGSDESGREPQSANAGLKSFLGL